MLDYYNCEKLASQHTKAGGRAVAENRHGVGSSAPVKYGLLTMGTISLALLMVAIASLSLLNAAIAHLNAWVAGLNPPLHLPGG